MKILENILCLLLGIFFQIILVLVFSIVLIFQNLCFISKKIKSGSLKDEGRNSERFGEI
jgi:hypothetical protein